MSRKRACRKCGAELAGDTLEGLCPACVALLAFTPDLEPAAADLLDLAGPRLRDFGDYELLEEIARGGMGVVYKARQLSLNRTVAVKMILTGQLASPADVQRFRAEAEAAANLQHPNIVAIHEVGQHDGQHYFSMEYVEGTDLAQWREECRALPADWRRIAQWVKTIAEAIQYAHEQGTLHRDLKPSNVLIDASDRPRLTDFGLAKRLQQDSGQTVTGQILGTPGYMSPEQAAGQPGKVGPATDIYSLGAILYFLLAGKAPFSGATPHETISMLLKDEPKPPEAFNPGVPRDLATICLKCLEKDPARRYATAKALSKDLDNFLKGEPIDARPINRAERALRAARRHPTVTALAAAAVVLPILAALLASRYFSDSRKSLTSAVDAAPIAQMPTNCAQGVCGLINGRIYVTSATDGNAGLRKSLYAYDLRSNSWIRRRDSNYIHSRPAGGVIGGEFLVASGQEESGDASRVLESYEPATDRWTVKSPMPTPRHSCAGVVLSNKFYVIGGRDGTGPVAAVESYDPFSDNWFNEPPMMTARAGCGAAVVKGTIYVVGGSTNNAGECASTVEIWRPGTTTWTTLPGPDVQMLTPVQHAFTVEVNGNIYVFGGMNEDGGAGLTQFLNVRGPGKSWDRQRPLPELRDSGCGALAAESKIWLFGGWSRHPNKEDAVPRPDVFVFDPTHNFWSQSAPAKRQGVK